MATKVKGPSSPSTPSVTTPTGSIVGASVKSEESAPTDPAAADAFQKAAQNLLSYKSSPLVSGAYKIFSDGIVFPSNLIDSKDPRNDPKYLRLLAAMLGLDDLERYFQTLNEEQEAERKIKRASRENQEGGEEKENSSDEEPAE